ncbi:hypothetical protein OEZ85_001360 [Tetradesmus obliquus]|uniref:STAS domain-containing protein n=1 Tax=Tetradesmus obliquus TaxID=3088 RepID=A0ABY8UN84_TETOB|nr:hypothetical protein OEZ85_001360 [Tetradesmus obliquus]
MYHGRVASVLSNDPLRFSFPRKQQSSASDEWLRFKAWLRAKRRRSAQQRASWGWLEYVALLLPCISWLRCYSIKRNLLFDVLAGVAVAFTMVPQSISYAAIAGVPAHMGLYGGFLPVLLYAVFGSSRQLGVGPVAVTSGLIYSGLLNHMDTHIVNPNNPAGPEQVAAQAAYNRAVIQLAFLVACIYTAVGMLRLGFIIRFLGHPVITGFTSGAAIVIASGQFKYMLGISYKSQHALQGEAHSIIQQLSAGHFVWQEFVMGCAMLLLLVGLKAASKRWRKAMFLKALGPFCACCIGIAVVAAAGWADGRGPIKIVQHIERGLPHFTADQWAPIESPGLGVLLPLAAIIAAVDMLESTSIARALACKNGYELEYNREIVALGIANFAGAMFGSYTTTGSFSRSAINDSCGAKTQLAGFITGLLVMAVLLFLTPVFALTPYNTMAAIIKFGVSQLVEVGVAMELLRVNLRDFAVWLTAFAVTTFAGVELGLMSSIGLSMAILILDTAFPQVSLLGRVPKTNTYRPILPADRREPGVGSGALQTTESCGRTAVTTPGVVAVRLDAPLLFINVISFEEKMQRHVKDAEDAVRATGVTTPGVVAVRLDAPLLFINVIRFEEKMQRHVKDAEDAVRATGGPGVKFLVLDLSAVTRSDSSGAHMLRDMAAAWKARGVQLVLCNPNSQVTQLLERTDIYSVLPRQWVYVHVHDGMRAAEACIAAGCTDAAHAAAAAGEVGVPASSAALLPGVGLTKMASIDESSNELTGKEQQQQQHVSIEMAGTNSHRDQCRVDDSAEKDEGTGR